MASEPVGAEQDEAAAGDHQPSRQQVVEWAVCGIVAAGARFVPVPLLDDVIKGRATRIALRRTLTAHGRTYDLDHVEALLDPQQRRHGILRALAGVPRRLLLFPVRKYVAIARVVRGGPQDVLAVVLLSRAVDRALAQGLLAGPDPAVLQREAVTVRTAFDAAARNADLRLVGGALADALAGVKEVGKDAVSLGRRLLRRDGEGADVAGAARTERPVRRGAEQVAQTLRRPEVVAQLDRFDATFDERLAAAGRRR